MSVLEIDNVTKTPVDKARMPEEAAVPDEKGAPATGEVRHEYTRTFPSLLTQLGVSLLVSTYQAGKVVAVGVAEGELTLSYHNFERAMGLAVGPGLIAVGARAQVWILRSAPDLARRVEPAGRHDACFLTRSSHFTGEIQAHELAWSSTSSLRAKNGNTFLPSPRRGGRAGDGGAERRSTPDVTLTPNPSPVEGEGRMNCAPGGRGEGEGELWLVNTAFGCLC